ncbi:FG-GAP-like repeat-containing protein [Nevskia ramosa]|uniref:FG-GAP-like repeat-containing protein n=1 Tax=Nevskia ramosa TaxID=64002 RepID=UPI002353A472|nr:FG-GAP-like repeat-containing protein [Nevskia ramosa]
MNRISQRRFVKVRKPSVALFFFPLLLSVAVQASPATVGVADAAVARPASGTTLLNFVLTRTGDAGYDVAVPFSTANDSAVAGTDYVTSIGVATIAAGATTATVPVPVLSGASTASKSFFLNLASATGIGATPSFAAAVAAGIGSDPRLVAAADFNGDGRPDLAVANAGSNTVSILLNTTAPGAASASFTLAASPAVGGNPQSLAVIDFNGDGKPDLAVANYNSNTVSILRNNTAPGAASASFVLAASPAVGGGPQSVAVGDFNGDGKPDLATANNSGDTVSILRNNTAPGAASASFILAASPAVGDQPASVAVVDFNGDGKPDLAVANYNSNTVSILRNGTATGAASASFTLVGSPAVGINPQSVAVGDFNGDGKPDLVTANLGSDSISVLRNNTATGASNASFELSTRPAVGRSPASVAVGDFNGDGKPDLVVTNAGSTTVSILRNRTLPGATNASFSVAAGPAVGTGSFSVAVGDFNSDGRPDLAVANQTSDSVSTLLNGTLPVAATASFSSQRFALPTSADSLVDLAVADFNGDGKRDLATANFDQTASIVLNTTVPGAVSTRFVHGASLAVGRNPMAVAAADFNGDGKPDVAVVNGGSSSNVSVFFNRTAPGATSASFTLAASPAVGSGPQAVAVGDFNGDGKPDLATANGGGSGDTDTVSILLNTTAPGATSGSFSLASFHIGPDPSAIVVADFNGDGKLDIATASYGNVDIVSVLRNSTPTGSATLSFSLAASPAVGRLSQAIATGDFNGDGKPDLATADFDGTVSILLNTTAAGATSFSFALTTTNASAGKNLKSLAVGDFDGDGKPDLALANGFTSVVILLNGTAQGAASASFTAAANLGVGTGPVSVVVADFNGDGKPDIVSADDPLGSDRKSRGTTLLNTQLRASLSDTFAVGTITPPSSTDTTPDSFDFLDPTDVPRSTVLTSNVVTISGINAPAPISITGGEYSIGCTASFTSTPGTIGNNQTVCLRQTSSPEHDTSTTATLTIGGVSGDFKVITGAAPTTTPGIRTNAGSYNFGSVRVGESSANQMLVITSSGTAALEIRSIALTGDYGGSHNCPATLPVGQTCTLTGRFTPKALGVRPGNITITTNAPGSPTVILLSGSGT